MVVVPQLTGSIVDVSGGQVPAGEIVRVHVKAAQGRDSGAAVVTSRPLVVAAGAQFTVNVVPGEAVLYVRTSTSVDSYRLVVTADTKTIGEAVRAAYA